MKALKRLFGFFWDKSLGVFLVIGAVNTVISMSLNFVLNNFAGWPLYFSTATAFTLTAAPAFYFNRKYSFKSKAPLSQSIFRFAAVTVVCFHISFLLNNLVMPWLRENWWHGMHPLLYSAITIVGIQGVFTVLNYCGQRLWAFKE